MQNQDARLRRSVGALHPLVLGTGKKLESVVGSLDTGMLGELPSREARARLMSM
jgi:hypothetical protein